MSNKIIWTVGILVASLLLGGGLWAWMTLVADDKPPQFQSISLAPPELRFVGGRVTVQAQVADDAGVLQVSGVVLRGGAAWLQLPVKKATQSPREFVYSAEFQAPSNLQPGGAPADYSIRLVAVDSVGQEVVGEAALQVFPPSAPPLPPQWTATDP